MLRLPEIHIHHHPIMFYMKQGFYLSNPEVPPVPLDLYLYTQYIHRQEASAGMLNNISGKVLHIHYIHLRN